MNMFRAFIELDEAYNDRQALIDQIKKSGKSYNFDKYTDAQLYRMAQRLQQPKIASKEPAHELDLDFDIEKPECCDCGVRLTDFGQCPVCDLGEEDLVEWVLASGKPVNKSSAMAVNSASTSTQKKHVVTIIYDHAAKKLRGRADDGTNGPAWVAFPSNLRDFDGQQYEVDQLIWNGKNYRVAGNIVEI
jgi:hypothetical protein